MNNRMNAVEIANLGGIVPPGISRASMAPPSRASGLSALGLRPGDVIPGMPGRTAYDYTGQLGGMGGAQGANQGWLGRIGGLEGIGSIAQALGSLGGIYTSMQGMKIARDQLNFSKNAWNTNVRNQTQSYNTALEDRLRSRGVAEGRETSEVDQQLARHRL